MFKTWLSIPLPLLGCLIFIYQSWLPTTTAWSLSQQAQVAPTLEKQLQFSESAYQADRLNTEPLRWQVGLLAAQATEAPIDPFATLAKGVIDRADAWLSQDATNYVNWQFAGDRMLMLASAANSKGMAYEVWLNQAESYYKVAAKRYPSSVQLQVQLAAVAGLLNDPKAWSQYLQEAERLSENIPHQDKKLESQAVYVPNGLSGPELANEGSTTDSNDWVSAELIRDWLRSRNDSS